MPKPVERIVVSVELGAASVRVTTAYHDFTGQCGVSSKTLPIPGHARTWKRRLSDLLRVHDQVVEDVRAWVNQLVLF